MIKGSPSGDALAALIMKLTTWGITEVATLNRKWVLKQRPRATRRGDELELREDAIRLPRTGEILVRNIYLSLDPTNRIWMSDREQYLPPVEVGHTMRE